jgi:Family of unknown function (DUF6492)
MSPVALLTPTYSRDLERCTLLCESVDRHVVPISKHYLLVPDADAPLFAPLASERRIVLPASRFLPSWLRPMPPIIRRRRRQFWWSWRAKPVNGWHVQQILKIAAAITLPETRYCILDSDIVFFRDFDLSRVGDPNPVPLLMKQDEVHPGTPRHARWIKTSHQLLGLPAPTLPAADFIGHIIVWDKDTVRAMAARIEASTGLDWIEALCRIRDFSEYMIYGAFVQSDASFSARHSVVRDTPCASYWDEPRLQGHELTRFLREASRRDVAFSVASFSGTAVNAIRTAIADHERHFASGAIPHPLTELAAPC